MSFLSDVAYFQEHADVLSQTLDELLVEAVPVVGDEPAYRFAVLAEVLGRDHGKAVTVAALALMRLGDLKAEPPKLSLDRNPVEAAIYDGVGVGEEMQPPPCADHEASELNCPVCTAQRRAFYTALGREAD